MLKVAIQLLLFDNAEENCLDQLFFFLDFADKVPEDVREQVLMTNLLPCVKVCCYNINTDKALLPNIEIALWSKLFTMVFI